MTEKQNFEITSGSKLLVATYHPDNAYVYEYLYRLPDTEKVPGDTRAVYLIATNLCRAIASKAGERITFEFKPLNEKLLAWARSVQYAGAVFGNWDEVAWNGSQVFRKYYYPETC